MDFGAQLRVVLLLLLLLLLSPLLPLAIQVRPTPSPRFGTTVHTFTVSFGVNWGFPFARVCFFTSLNSTSPVPRCTAVWHVICYSAVLPVIPRAFLSRDPARARRITNATLVIVFGRGIVHPSMWLLAGQNLLFLFFVLYMFITPRRELPDPCRFFVRIFRFFLAFGASIICITCIYIVFGGYYAYWPPWSSEFSTTQNYYSLREFWTRKCIKSSANNNNNNNNYECWCRLARVMGKSVLRPMLNPLPVDEGIIRI